MRESVLKFAAQMEKVLQEHDDKECGWENTHLEFLTERLNSNVKSLNKEFDKPLIQITSFTELINSQQKTLIDIANYCMMIHENIRL